MTINNPSVAISTTYRSDDNTVYVVTSEADAGTGDQSTVTQNVLATLDKVIAQLKRARP